jgi:hypothetical protein
MIAVTEETDIEFLRRARRRVEELDRDVRHAQRRLASMTWLLLATVVCWSVAHVVMIVVGWMQ